MVTEVPSTTEDNGRDQMGRFSTGNRAAKGNPHHKRVAQLRAVLMEAVTPERMRAVIDKLIELAQDGDVQAIRELLDRSIGKADQKVTAEGLEGITIVIKGPDPD